MAARQIEARVAALEAQMKELQDKLESVKADPKKLVEPGNLKKHCVDNVAGVFAGDPDFLEAMRLGRKYRESLRPKTTKKSTSGRSKSAKR